MHLITEKKMTCKNNKACGEPKIRNLVAVQPEQDEHTWQKHINNMIANVHHIHDGEFVVLVTDSPSEPFMISQAKAFAIGEEEGVMYQIDRNFQGKFGPVCKGDNMLNFLKFEPIELGSEIYHMTKKQWPVYVELIAVRALKMQFMHAENIPEKIDMKMKYLLPAEERWQILLTIPCKAWDWQNTPSEPFDADLAKNS